MKRSALHRIGVFLAAGLVVAAFAVLSISLQRGGEAVDGLSSVPGLVIADGSAD